MRFTLPDGKAGYFDTEGRSLKRFFLKSPLKFEPRITSRFSRSRMHPVLKYARAHNGVDYAAPIGRAGRQRVERRRDAGRLDEWRRPYGARQAHERLRERVPAPVGDCRGHHPGARVGQGDLVGNVGKTGLATGVHLHYGLRRNGRYVNPMTEHQNLPPGEPVPALLKAAFEAERDKLFASMRQPARTLLADDEQ